MPKISPPRTSPVNALCGFPIDLEWLRVYAFTRVRVHACACERVLGHAFTRSRVMVRSAAQFGEIKDIEGAP